MRAAWIVLGFCPLGAAFFACSGPDSLGPPNNDAGSDSLRRRRDAALPDTAPPPYVPLGIRCVRDAGAPPPFLLPDSGTTDAAGTVPTPLVLSTQGVVAHLPVFVPITFDGDSLRDSLEDFVASVGCTDYWHAVATEYGIGDGISSPPVHVSDTAPTTISDQQIRAWINIQLASNPAFPQPDSNTVYAVFYPDGTSVTADFGTACVMFGGYHAFSSFKGTPYSYAVMPRCSQGIDGMTAVTSHELVESVTDPGPGGYSAVGDEFIAWALAGTASEVGDMCEFASDANFLPLGYPFRVQRTWSNKAAFFGHNPCVPADSPTWFVAAPVMNDLVHVNYFGQDVQALGVKLAPGTKTVIDVQMIADGTMGAWTVTAQDVTQLFMSKTTLKMSLDKGAGQAGDVLKLSISRVGTNTTWNAEPFVLHSESNGADHLWFGVVGD